MSYDSVSIAMIVTIGKYTTVFMPLRGEWNSSTQVTITCITLFGIAG